MRLSASTRLDARQRRVEMPIPHALGEPCRVIHLLRSRFPEPLATDLLWEFTCFPCSDGDALKQAEAIVAAEDAGSLDEHLAEQRRLQEIGMQQAALWDDDLPDGDRSKFEADLRALGAEPEPPPPPRKPRYKISLAPSFVQSLAVATGSHPIRAAEKFVKEGWEILPSNSPAPVADEEKA